jgi:hypothetical protein
MREIRDVKRCPACDSVLTVLVHDRDVDDEGQPRQMIHWLPRRKHSADECSRARALYAEEWPTLW